MVGVANKRYVFFRPGDTIPSGYQIMASASKIDPSRPVLISRPN